MPKVSEDYPKKVGSSLYLEPNQWDQVKALATMKGKNQSKILRHLVELGLSKYFDDPYNLW